MCVCMCVSECVSAQPCVWKINLLKQREIRSINWFVRNTHKQLLLHIYIYIYSVPSVWIILIKGTWQKRLVRSTKLTILISKIRHEINLCDGQLIKIRSAINYGRNNKDASIEAPNSQTVTCSSGTKAAPGSRVSHPSMNTVFRGNDVGRSEQHVGHRIRTLR